MSSAKYLGIFMDHSSAHLIEHAADDTKRSEVITSSFTHEAKESILHKGENQMHNKEQQAASSYYIKLMGICRQYEMVLLFGPTSAKSELHNLMKTDHHFDTIRVEVRQSDKLTDNQELAFVRDYFSSHIAHNK